VRHSSPIVEASHFWHSSAGHSCTINIPQLPDLVPVIYRDVTIRQTPKVVIVINIYRSQVRVQINRVTEP
jgi:hypothetical protein